MYKVTYCQISEENLNIQTVLTSPEKGWLVLVSWLNVFVHDLQLVLRKAFEKKKKKRFQTVGIIRSFI